VNLPLHRTEDVWRNLLRPQIFFVLSRSKVPRQSIDFLSCRVGCEFITITISIARREAAENFSSLGGLHWLAIYQGGARTMQSYQLLVACPKCHAWPMAVHAGKREMGVGSAMVAKCGHQEEERLGGAHAKRESPQQHETAGGGF